MKVIVTCGPSYEPVDEVRRITNFSTGELGVLLSETLAAAGFEAICLRGVAATCALLPAGAVVHSFTTNDDLAARLLDLRKSDDVVGVFHAAALCDYRVKHVSDTNGRTAEGAKIASRNGALTIQLEPATKLISHLRDWFPRSLIVGWKYELDGDRNDVIAKGRRQITENGTDACVVNGRAYGDGFGIVGLEQSIHEIADKRSLCAFFAAWLKSSLAPNTERNAKFDAISRKVFEQASTNGAWTQCINSASPSSW